MSRQIHIAIIEDNETMRAGLEQVLAIFEFQCTGFENAETFLKQGPPAECDLVIADYKLPGQTGLDIVQALQNSHPELPVVLITAFGSIELAVSAMQSGAADFITKPFSADEIRIKIERILDRQRDKKALKRARQENLYLRDQLEQSFNHGEIIGDSKRMQAVFRTLQKVAQTETAVIIYGESGTGKELAARAIHKNGARAEQPFIRVNCGALAETLLESELFGHEKGAFTGAVRQRSGRFELADNGTIFLDEVGEISPAMQVKLLRVLQEREFERVGGEKTLQVDVRVIAATNRHLEAEVEAGRFREDLFYRLQVIPIHLPPLRERDGDLELLVQAFLQRLGAQFGKTGLHLQQGLMQRFRDYPWPGNIRELENVLERAAVLCDGETITAADLPPLVKDRGAVFALPDEDLDLNQTLADVEQALIERALQKTHGVKAEAARLLGIKTTTLLYKLSKYEIS